MECKTELKRRQKIESEDYKVGYEFAFACRKEIADNGCEKRNAANEVEITKRSRILLCLEDVERNQEGILGAKCKVELNKERRQVMSDFSISPELAVHCAKDIGETCRVGQEPGAVIHCLMAAVADRNILSGPECQRSLVSLLQEVNVASNWKLDPVLQQSCQDVVTQVCDAKGPSAGENGQSQVMDCLLRAYDSPFMTDVCSKTLKEIQYFLARDYALTPKLYKACRRDAESLCFSNRDWHNHEDQSDKFVFPCLVRHLYGFEDDPLSKKCQVQVKTMLLKRSKSVRLHPELEANCRADLFTHCSNVKDEKGQEFICLQDHLTELDGECQESVISHTRVEAQDANLNPVIASACAEVIEDHCAKQAAEEDGSLIRCLIAFKMDRDEDEVMNPNYEKCDKAIHHWQVNSVRDVRFSVKFWKTCKPEIKKFCGNFGTGSKWEMIDCLSEIVAQDVLDEKRTNNFESRKVSESCQNELKFQLLQKHSDVELNPKIQSSCEKEIQSFCTGENVLECLKSQQHENLSLRCRSAVFSEEKEEAIFNKVDQHLMTTCKKEIKHFCRESDFEPNGILTCLKLAKDDSLFSHHCRQVVRKRVIQQSKDFRLNPNLQVACAPDMSRHCTHLINENPNVERDFLDGKLINCLMKKVMADRQMVGPQCRAEIKQMMRQAAVDFETDPILLQYCPNSISKCKESLDLTAGHAREDGGKIEGKK